MEFLERLKEIISKPAETLTEEEKRFLLARREYLSRKDLKKFAKLIKEHEAKLKTEEKKSEEKKSEEKK